MLPGMPKRAWITVLAYGALAASLLLCLWIITFAPVRLSWGRELVGAAIAVVAMLVGLHLAPRRADAPRTAPPPSPQTATDAASREPTPSDDMLSPREHAVLRQLCEGLSNKEIARALSVSENTVKTHLANIYAKLGVGRRTEALRAARERGLA